VAQVGVLCFNAIIRDQPILGLRFEGRQIGQLTGDARSQVADLVQVRENHAVTVQVAGYKNQITLRQLGAKADTGQVYDELARAGREGNFFKRLLSQIRASVGAFDVRLATPLNAKLVSDYIASIDKQIAIAPTDADFVWDGQAAIVQSHKPGMSLDSKAAAQALQYADVRSSLPLTLPTKVVPAAISADKLEARLTEVRKIAQKPLTVGAGESKVVVDQAQLVAMVVPKLVLDQKEPKQMVQLSFDEAKIRSIADEVLKPVVVAPVSTIVSSSGKVVRQGKSGRQAKHDAPADVLAALIARQTGAGAPDAVDIPLVIVEPPIVRQAAQASVRARTGTGLIRLTFDDGPGGYTNQILDILKRYNVHATFYVVGRNVPRYVDQMRRIKNEGHAVCNHTYNHAKLSRLGRDRIRQELADTQSAIQDAIGITPGCMRPPYAAQNQALREVAASLSLSVDMWSVDPRDWAKPGSGAIKNRVLSGVGPGSVVLLHILNQQTVDALPGIIEGIRAAGYTLE
jgi:peptidoglycan/xylan/chitin deacetylase (PgdA/CDA1 family)